MGVILCVGGLGTLGYLALVSDLLYGDPGPTAANVLIGVLSAVVDNIPLMFAVLSAPVHRLGRRYGAHGQTRGCYTFFSHLQWTWAIALGYAAGIGTHLSLNAPLF